MGDNQNARDNEAPTIENEHKGPIGKVAENDQCDTDNRRKHPPPAANEDSDAHWSHVFNIPDVCYENNSWATMNQFGLQRQCSGKLGRNKRDVNVDEREVRE